MTSARALSRFRAPDEGGCEERAWEVVREAYRTRAQVPRRRAYAWWTVVLATGVVLAAVLALSPAGATVGRLITRALGVQHARTALFSLPAPGRVLVYGPGGTWTVATDGSSRRLGEWRQAVWSPHGRYLAVTLRDRLVVVNGSGLAQWSLARPNVRDPRWLSPSGFRLAYISGRDLRVVAGDGTGDQLEASDVKPVAPAWRPGYSYQVAYVQGNGGLAVRDALNGALVWTARPPRPLLGLVWSGDGQRIVARSGNAVFVYNAAGRLLSNQPAPGSGTVVGSALSPDGRRLALIVSKGAQTTALIESVGGPSAATRRLLAGQGLGQVTWSPNGRWLLITWPAADQWVFVRAVGSPRIVAVGRISRQFSAGRAAGFPRLAGWCCNAPGTSR